MRVDHVRALWLAHALTLSVIVGIAAGALSFIGGDAPAQAILTGGGAFIATATVSLLILTFLATGSNIDHKDL